MKTFKQLRERCWTGYKPVPGKKPYSPGSCKLEDAGGAAAVAGPTDVRYVGLGVRVVLVLGAEAKLVADNTLLLLVVVVNLLLLRPLLLTLLMLLLSLFVEHDLVLEQIGLATHSSR